MKNNLEIIDIYYKKYKNTINIADIFKHYFRGNNLLHVALLFDAVDIFDYLIEKEQEFNFLDMVNFEGENIFHMIARNNKEKFLKIASGSDIAKLHINRANIAGQKPIDIAVMNNMFEVIVILIEHGAEIEDAVAFHIADMTINHLIRNIFDILTSNGAFFEIKQDDIALISKLKIVIKKYLLCFNPKKNDNCDLYINDFIASLMKASIHQKNINDAYIIITPIVRNLIKGVVYV
jgi:ankyrin repeat protein